MCFLLKLLEFPVSPLKGPETRRSWNKLSNVMKQSGRAGVRIQFCQFLQPIQLVLFNQPTAGSVAKVLLALPWKIYLFLKRVISLWATSHFFFKISIIYPEHNYTLQDERESVLNVKHRVYYRFLLSALGTLCPWRTLLLPLHGSHLPAPRALASAAWLLINKALHLHRGSLSSQVYNKRASHS